VNNVFVAADIVGFVVPPEVITSARYAAASASKPLSEVVGVGVRVSVGVGVGVDEEVMVLSPPYLS